MPRTPSARTSKYAGRSSGRRSGGSLRINPCREVLTNCRVGASRGGKETKKGPSITSRHTRYKICNTTKTALSTIFQLKYRTGLLEGCNREKQPGKTDKKKIPRTGLTILTKNRTTQQKQSLPVQISNIFSQFLCIFSFKMILETSR